VHSFVFPPMVRLHLSSRYLTPLLALSLLACSKSSTPTPTPTPPVVKTTFTNPLLSVGPDPWVYEKDDFYYYMHTTGGDVTLRKTAKMSELGGAPSTIIWRAPSSGNYSSHVWAPELHFLDGKWYVYFTAGPSNCCDGQRSWVLENTSADPTTGNWIEKGRAFNPTEDYWSIDMTVFEQNGNHYALWSGHETTGKEEQRILTYTAAKQLQLVGPPGRCWLCANGRRTLIGHYAGPAIDVL
jgi:beta-xylosidase